jgi:hypothetical protein
MAIGYWLLALLWKYEIIAYKSCPTFSILTFSPSHLFTKAVGY